MSQDSKTEVLSLGVFHFDFPNNDVVPVDSSEQIDVLKREYQDEIVDLVKKLKDFRPTVIVVERPRSKQSQIDSLYKSYLLKDHELARSEIEQIGFRLGKVLGIEKLYCVDEWGEFNSQVSDMIYGDDTIIKKDFSNYYLKNEDLELKYNPEPVFKSEGILAELRRLNDTENIQKSLGNYLIEAFKYEHEEGDFFGVHFETGRWFNRNLKIFRNIQRIPVDSEDRIFVLYGAGHMNLLNIFFNSSPEFELVDAIDYL
ncbi:hypothetical protein E0K83_09880 [Gramella sp. BOM4]|nr:hypothetical protein [Christiangramia bathymodioli]